MKLDAKKFIFKTKTNVRGIKSPAVWYNGENGSFPIAYVRKPKNVEQEDFDRFVNALSIFLYPMVLDDENRE